MRPKPHDWRPVGVPLPSAKPAESACFRASVRVARARPSRREGRFAPDEGRPTRPPVPLGPSGRDVFSVSEQSVLSRPRCVVDGSRTRDTQVMSLVLYPLSYHEPVPPRFRIPARNTPRRPSEDGAKRAAGPTGPAACLKIEAAHSAPQSPPVGLEPTPIFRGLPLPNASQRARSLPPSFLFVVRLRESGSSVHEPGRSRLALPDNRSLGYAKAQTPRPPRVFARRATFEAIEADRTAEPHGSLLGRNSPVAAARETAGGRRTEPSRIRLKDWANSMPRYRRPRKRLETRSPD